MPISDHSLYDLNRPHLPPYPIVGLRGGAAVLTRALHDVVKDCVVETSVRLNMIWMKDLP